MQRIGPDRRKFSQELALLVEAAQVLAQHTADSFTKRCGDSSTISTPIINMVCENVMVTNPASTSLNTPAQNFDSSSTIPAFTSDEAIASGSAATDTLGTHESTEAASKVTEVQGQAEHASVGSSTQPVNSQSTEIALSISIEPITSLQPLKPVPELDQSKVCRQSVADATAQTESVEHVSLPLDPKIREEMDRRLRQLLDEALAEFNTGRTWYKQHLPDSSIEAASDLGPTTVAMLRHQASAAADNDEASKAQPRLSREAVIRTRLERGEYQYLKDVPDRFADSGEAESEADYCPTDLDNEQVELTERIQSTLTTEDHEASAEAQPTRSNFEIAARGDTSWFREPDKPDRQQPTTVRDDREQRVSELEANALQRKVYQQSSANRNAYFDENYAAGQERCIRTRSRNPEYVVLEGRSHVLNANDGLRGHKKTRMVDEFIQSERLRRSIEETRRQLEETKREAKRPQ
jgi:hypothetical protein